MRHSFFPIVALLAAFGAAPVLAAEASLPAVALTAKQSAALGIETQAVRRGGSAASGGLPAQVVVPTGQLRVLAAPVAALVEQILVAPGDSVRQGQPLARLAGPQLLELQRDVRQSASQAALSQQQLQRDEALFREGIIAEARLQGSRAQHAQSAAQLGERRAALKLAGAGENGGAAAVLAPIDGVVLEQFISVGQRVEAAAPLFKIGRLSPLWLEIQAPAVLADGLKIGAAVRVGKEEGKDNKGPSGKLIQIGRQVGSGQTLTLRARIDSGTEQLRPGQLVEASIETSPGSGKQAALWRLPASAVLRAQEAAYVFVATANGFQARAVRVEGQSGGLSGEQALLSGDFKDGELVAIKGLSALKSAAQGAGKAE